eukprot:CAMPEP_0181342250 /NCGR_PEP_ID=MMETSP1101-20121128/30891_1 /TAXON_ID=46948 /ORGANISM="Rhodomonas abbreviata, Strain Caron Lab Isolate" /LENGTH=188 /DNA_ID=CAMNT_0023453677 /DNA_START=15 /DNA_END=581 /DNA_ORIENTATION=-
MDMEHIGDEVEGVRNRLSFLAPPGGYAPIPDGDEGKGKRLSRELPPDTPFDPGFLTLYFIQIYLGQLVMQLVVLIWSFTQDEHAMEPRVMLCLDCFAVSLLVVEVTSGLLSRGWEFLEVSLAIYFVVMILNDWDIEHHVGLEFAHAMKLLRDIARLVRLPLFIRNVFAIWKWHVGHAREKVREHGSAA